MWTLNRACERRFYMSKYIFLLTILAIFFFACKTPQTSSISIQSQPEEQPKEEWKLIEEGPDKGKYEGKLWNLYAHAEFENEGDSKFIKFTISKQYGSQKDAVENCKRLGEKANEKIGEFGPTTMISKPEGKVISNGGIFKSCG